MPSTMPTGHLDYFDDGVAGGWARDPATERALVDIHLDDRWVGTALADQFRADLKDAAIGDGAYGFVFRIPHQLLTPGQHRLTVRVQGSDADLIGSPLTFIGATGDTSSVISEPDLIKNSRIEHPLNLRGTAAPGLISVAPGVGIEFSKDSFGYTSFAVADIAPLAYSGDGNFVPALRIRSVGKTAHTRLMFDMSGLGTLIYGDVAVTTMFERHQADESFQLRVGIAQQTDGAFKSMWSQRVDRVLDGVVEWTTTIPTSKFNKLVGNSVGNRIYFDLMGRADIALAGPRLTFERPRVVDLPGAFEDPAIAEQWDSLPPAKVLQSEQIPRATWLMAERLPVAEIIVPVFNAKALVRETIASVEKNTNQPHLLTVIDDGSLPGLQHDIATWIRERPWARLIRSPKNEGYTVAINKAIKSAAGNTVVILNSDTHVTPGWLEGLLECLGVSEDTGLAGPLSNAATWQSIPEVSRDGAWSVNHLPAGVVPEEIAEQVRSLSTRAFPEVLLLNGFCLAIKRDVFSRCGLFDEVAFPVGYGEENDFCLRAADAGFKLRVADASYVYHHKSASFGAARRAELSKRGARILEERYGAERIREAEDSLKELPAIETIRRALRLTPEPPS